MAPSESAGIPKNATGSAAVAPLDADRPKIRSLKTPWRQRAIGNDRRVLGGTAIAAANPAPDALAALEDENRRLKGLLAHRLRQENTQLRKMLDRFGSV